MSKSIVHGGPARLKAVPPAELTELYGLARELQCEEGLRLAAALVAAVAIFDDLTWYAEEWDAFAMTFGWEVPR